MARGRRPHLSEDARVAQMRRVQASAARRAAGPDVAPVKCGSFQVNSNLPLTAGLTLASYAQWSMAEHGSASIFFDLLEILHAYHRGGGFGRRAQWIER